MISQLRYLLHEKKRQKAKLNIAFCLFRTFSVRIFNLCITSTSSLFRNKGLCNRSPVQHNQSGAIMETYEQKKKKILKKLELKFNEAGVYGY